MKKLVVILSGGLIQRADGYWSTTKYDEPGDKGGALGDHMRIIAGAYRYHDAPEDIIILVSGGKGHQTIDDDAPILADVMKRELIEKGVPKEGIIQDIRSNSSFEQLQYISTLIQDYEIIEIISNRYHVERLETMVEYFDELSPLKKNSIVFSNAEDIALEHDVTKWKSVIKKAYESENMKSRIVSEKKGIEDIKEGRYKVYGR